MPALSAELTYTALAAAFTGLIWIPIIVDRFFEIGVWKTLQNPEPNRLPRAGWAYRLTRAHVNAVENLVVFAPLALAVHIAGQGTPATALASAAFFWARVAHAVVYGLGLPVARTLAFLVGFGAQAYLALRLFNIA
jgi:uncharacterized MAPEG superfamily protein